MSIIDEHYKLRDIRSKNYNQQILYQSFVSFTTILYTAFMFVNIYNKINNLQNIFFYIFGLYLGDLLSGLIHVFLDKKKVNGFSMIDKMAFSFQYSHHKNPSEFYSNQQILGISCQLKITFLLGVPIYCLTVALVSNNNIQLALLLMNLSAVWSQIFHAFAHMPFKQIPLIIQILQKINIIIPPHVHRSHHSSYDGNFSIVNGWSNPFLNLLYLYILRPIMSFFPNYFIE